MSIPIPNVRVNVTIGNIGCCQGGCCSKGAKVHENNVVTFNAKKVAIEPKKEGCFLSCLKKLGSCLACSKEDEEEQNRLATFMFRHHLQEMYGERRCTRVFVDSGIDMGRKHTLGEPLRVGECQRLLELAKRLEEEAQEREESRSITPPREEDTPLMPPLGDFEFPRQMTQDPNRIDLDFQPKEKV